MSERDWRQEAIDYLSAREFDGRGYCCMKLRHPAGGRPTCFGVIFRDRVTRIYLRNDHGEVSNEFQDYASISAMLDAGWDID